MWKSGLLALVVAACMCEAVYAGPISVTAGASALPVVEDFEGFVSKDYPGTTISFHGGKLAEAFKNQTVDRSGASDVLTTTGPLGPLVLVPNSGVGENVGILDYFDNNGQPTKVVYGDLGQNVGEGMLSILFDSVQTTFGLDILGGNGEGDKANFFFYSAAGALLDTVAVSLTSDVSDSFTFSTSGAGFSGISITSTDASGIAFDNFRFTVASVPEPGTLALAALALAALGANRRKKIDKKR